MNIISSGRGLYYSCTTSELPPKSMVENGDVARTNHTDAMFLGQFTDFNFNI